MLLVQLSVIMLFVLFFKSKEVIMACLLAVVQETIFDITKDSTLSHFAFITTICLRTPLNGIRFQDLM